MGLASSRRSAFAVSIPPRSKTHGVEKAPYRQFLTFKNGPELRMTTVAEARLRPTLPVVERRRARPIVWWATFGALTGLVASYLVVRWLASNPTSVPSGPTPLPHWMRIDELIQQTVYPILWLVVLYWFLVRPWRRERKITPDGMLAIVFAGLYWQDPLTDGLQPWFTYNTHLINFGSWAHYLPGYLAPNAQIAEPLLFAGPMYLCWLLPGVVAANALMRRAQTRWPSLGNVGLVGLCFAFFAVVDLVVEIGWMRLGNDFYGVMGPSWMTIGKGHYYQFPLYEPVLFGGLWTTWACLRFYRSDTGLTVAERGLDRLTVTPRARSLIRILALWGLFNAVFFVFDIPYTISGLYQHTWPNDVISRSYLTDGLCGPGTTYACPGGAIPIPRAQSSHVSPDGQLVKPDANRTGP
jgi:hypothetical protein